MPGILFNFKINSLWVTSHLSTNADDWVPHMCLSSNSSEIKSKYSN